MALINYITQVQLDYGALALLPQELERAAITKPLVVTDAGVRAAGLLDVFIPGLFSVLIPSLFSVVAHGSLSAVVGFLRGGCLLGCQGLGGHQLGQVIYESDQRTLELRRQTGFSACHGW